jgi:dipeptidyl aminopeptidase/acylaminoacyl peptidase
VIALASPISHIDRKDPPVLLIHGERDATVPVEQSRRFHAALQTQGVPSQLKLIPGVDHSFVGATLEATRAASLTALDETFAFIDATIGSRP